MEKLEEDRPSGITLLPSRRLVEVDNEEEWNENSNSNYFPMILKGLLCIFAMLMLPFVTFGIRKLGTMIVSDIRLIGWSWVVLFILSFFLTSTHYIFTGSHDGKHNQESSLLLRTSQ